MKQITAIFSERAQSVKSRES